MRGNSIAADWVRLVFAIAVVWCHAAFAQHDRRGAVTGSASGTGGLSCEILDAAPTAPHPYKRVDSVDSELTWLRSALSRYIETEGRDVDVTPEEANDGMTRKDKIAQWLDTKLNDPAAWPAIRMFLYEARRKAAEHAQQVRGRRLAELRDLHREFFRLTTELNRSYQAKNPGAQAPVAPLARLESLASSLLAPANNSSDDLPTGPYKEIETELAINERAPGVNFDQPHIQEYLRLPAVMAKQRELDSRITQLRSQIEDTRRELAALRMQPTPDEDAVERLADRIMELQDEEIGVLEERARVRHPSYRRVPQDGELRAYYTRFADIFATEDRLRELFNRMEVLAQSIPPAPPTTRDQLSSFELMLQQIERMPLAFALSVDDGEAGGMRLRTALMFRGDRVEGSRRLFFVVPDPYREDPLRRRVRAAVTGPSFDSVPVRHFLACR